MEGVTQREANDVAHAVLSATRFLAPNGTTRLGITLVPHRDAARAAAGGKELILDPTPAANEIPIVAGRGDFVDVTTADGTTYSALQVTRVEIDDHGPLFFVEAPKSWHVPKPSPTSTDAPRPPAETTLQLRSDDLTLAMECATFDSVKALVVLPLTRDTGLSYARLLGTPPRGCVSAAVRKAGAALSKAFAARMVAAAGQKGAWPYTSGGGRSRGDAHPLS